MERGTRFIWRETRRAPGDVFAGFDGAVDIPIPIEHIMVEGESIACASWAVPPPIALESVRWVRKRARAEALGLDRVLIAGGPYKSLNIPHATLATPYLDFYVRGDRELLAELLPDACAIGKGNSIGFGTVFAWDVQCDEDDRSVWRNAAPQRALPAAVRSQCREGTYQAREGTLRAPYWVRHSLTDVVHPLGPFGAPSPE